jgi:Bacterial archaeo-eukaryotic release factor family 10
MLSTSLLESFSRLPSPLLTAYVRTSPDEASLQGAAPRYLHLLKEEGQSVAENLASNGQGPFLKQLERVTKFLSQRKSHGSFVIFAGSSVWEVVALQAEVRSELTWGKPSLTQLLWLSREHKQYGIVAVDHKGARFFHYSLGEIVEGKEKEFAIDTSGWKHEELGHVTGQGVKKTRGSQREVFDRRMENQYARLCGQTAQQAATLFSAKDLAAVFLVGPDKLITAVEAKFPRTLRLPIVRVDQDLARVDPSELRRHLEPRIAAWEGEHQTALVNAIAEAERGTIGGFDETLAQLQKGKVGILVLARDFDTLLHQCVECRWMDRSADPVCPACGSQRRPITLRESLPELLRKHRVELEIVSGEAAKRLKETGGMGAWIRQPKKITARAGD